MHRCSWDYARMDPDANAWILKGAWDCARMGPEPNAQVIEKAWDCARHWPIAQCTDPPEGVGLCRNGPSNAWVLKMT